MRTSPARGSRNPGMPQDPCSSFRLCGGVSPWSQMHQTTLPRGKQIAIDPSAGVTAVDVELGVAAEAAGAAIAPNGRAIAIAATNLIILLDISVPRCRVTCPVQPGNLGDCRRAAALVLERRSLLKQTVVRLLSLASPLSEAAHDALRRSRPRPVVMVLMTSDSHTVKLPNQILCGNGPVPGTVTTTSTWRLR